MQNLQTSAKNARKCKSGDYSLGDPIGDSSLGYRWTAAFVSAMDRLAAPLLRQSSNGAISPHVTEATSIDIASTPCQSTMRSVWH
jgi:hypothetical protein